MERWFFEATNGLAWGKFMVGRFDAYDWAATSEVDPGKSLLRARGWGPEHHLVLDLQTGQGAVFAVQPGGVAEADVNKARIWVCPLFRPFLQWLYEQGTGQSFYGLPKVVTFPLVEEPQPPGV